MTLWMQSTAVLPANGDNVWIRRFPAIDHPKQAVFLYWSGIEPQFQLTVLAPDAYHPATLTIPAYLVHSWRPRG
jgi:hypothetical protein